MAAVTVQSNASEVFQSILIDLQGLTDKEKLLRPLMFDLIDIMKERIHEKGLASDGSAIGTYSPGYLKLRETKYKRSSDTKIIVSLTRQLEGDWAVIATEKGYGIGFNNEFNFHKAQGVEQVKQVKIFDLTTQEVEYANEFIDKKVSELLNG